MVRKVALTAHVTCSVGWLGSVAAFLAISIAGRTSADPTTIRSAYLAMNLIGGFVIVPLGIASLATGVIQGAGTSWGVFRHYWVVTKLLLTIGATFLLVLHQLTAVATAAHRVSGDALVPDPTLRAIGSQLVADASLAIVVLFATTTLSVFKPWGLTRYGRRELGRPEESGSSSGRTIIIVLVVAVLLAVAISHLAGGGMRHH